MSDKYRMTPHGSTFIVNQNAGVTVGVYSTLQEAQREIETCEQDDLMLKTARSLVKKAVDVLVRMHHIDRRAAYGWIREAAD
jgi:AmiR/NasT family two-component response regulator